MVMWQNRRYGYICRPIPCHMRGGALRHTAPTIGESATLGQRCQLCAGAQEPTPQWPAAYPSAGDSSDRPYMELAGVYLAASPYRSRLTKHIGQLDCMAADPSPPRPLSMS